MKRVWQKWLIKHYSGDFNISDEPRPGRPTEIDSSDVKAIVDVNASQTVLEFATAIIISHTSIENHLRQLE